MVLSGHEIWMLAVREVYGCCREENLSGVFRYLWKNWYSLQKWQLWALSSFEAEIPKGRTTMVVEAHWKVLKMDNLYKFVAPRLDFLLFVLFKLFIPRQLSRRNHLLVGITTPHWKKNLLNNGSYCWTVEWGQLNI
jgi:hypothetical protein